MNQPTIYDIVSHLDEPPRYLGLTIDELFVGVIGMLLLVTSSHRLVVVGVFFGLYSALKYLKRGNGPKYFLVLIYWHLPASVAQIFVPKLPASSFRVWYG